MWQVNQDSGMNFVIEHAAAAAKTTATPVNPVTCELLILAACHRWTVQQGAVCMSAAVMVQPTS
jgi:hypothetical protein